MKKILITILLCMLISPSFVFADEVVITIPDYDVTVNGELIDTEHSQYPVIVYKSITYFPMTSDYLAGIGLDLQFNATDGLKLNVNDKVGVFKQSFLGASNRLGSQHTAQLAPFKVSVNGSMINNDTEEYPVLLYKDITYFPMTWRFAVEEFGWKTSWSNETGFGISTNNQNDVSDTSKDNSTKNSYTEDASSIDEGSKVYTNNIEEQVLLDHNGIKITAKSIDFQGSYFGPEVKVLIENDSDQDIMVQVRDMSVNGIMIEPIFSSNILVGKKVNDTITLTQSSLEDANITTIKDIELEFHIVDKDSWDDVYDSEVIKILADVDPSFEQAYTSEGNLILEQGDIKITALGLDTEDELFGPELKLFIENNSKDDVMIQIRDESVNGYMVSTTFSSEIVSGKCIYDSITFYESSLEENGIETIKDVEFYFHVVTKDSWDDIFNTETISLEVE